MRNSEASSREGARGLLRGASGLEEGYVLFSPLLSTTTYLIDRQGKVVHAWESGHAPGACVDLLDNGHLLRCGRQENPEVFNGAGQGGRIQEFTWDGGLVWDFRFASRERMQHHDAEVLPNGNVLLIAWEHRSEPEAIAAGRRPDLVGAAGLWPDFVVEVRPRRPAGGEVVWEWHVWDQLIQDVDAGRDHYGVVTEHPGRIDLNGDRNLAPEDDDLLLRLKSLGYLSGSSTTKERRADFMHSNAIAYNPDLDQIALSVLRFNEIWIIDHGTTSEQAAGHSGGRAGDLLYRWGNPAAYGRGGLQDRRLFSQHDVRWIPEGYPGAGHLMIFNNGSGRMGRPWSSVIEIEPPLISAGRYALPAGGPFGPQRPKWEYTAPDRESFFGDFVSGAHRLRNGNTFVCSGPQGRFFEVTAAGEIVWEYLNPFSGDVPNPQGDPPWSVFRATFIPVDHPALKERDLVPLRPQPSHPLPGPARRKTRTD